MKLLYFLHKWLPPCRATHSISSVSTVPRPCNSWPEWQQPQGHDTGIKVYNTRVKRKVPLIIQQPGLLTWYVCGPTVYESPHIGHGLCYIRFDIIRRILRDYFKLNVVKVMGITDVDDKIIKKANYFKVDISEVSRHFEREFLHDMSLLGIERATLYTRVTEHIEPIVAFIQDLLEAELAYRVDDGSVFFNNIAYRKSRGLELPDVVPCSRVSNNENSISLTEEELQAMDTLHGFTDSPSPAKRHPIDFALWKGCKSGEPSWPAPFGPGRPGWHIECSAMASAIFGQTVDVHSGGIDLWFPHHYCEEAQSCARHGSSVWTNYWWHSGHLTLQREKMSKSVGNVISVQQLLKEHSAEAFRHFALASHYTSRVMYGDSTLQNAAVEISKFQALLDACHHYLTSPSHPCRPEARRRGQELMKVLQRTKLAVDAALRDDFNTSWALREVLVLVSATHIFLQQSAVSSPTHEDDTLLSEGRDNELLIAVDENPERNEIRDSEAVSRVSQSTTTDASFESVSSSCFTGLHGPSMSPVRVTDGRYEVAAVRNYIFNLMKMFGMNYRTRELTADANAGGGGGDSSAVQLAFPDVMRSLLNFRQQVRDFALLKNLTEEQRAKLSRAEKSELRRERAALMQACDDLREELGSHGVAVKDLKDSSSWTLSNLTSSVPESSVKTKK